MSEDLVERQDGLEGKLEKVIKLLYGVAVVAAAIGGWLAKTDFNVAQNRKDIDELRTITNGDHDILIEIRTKVNQLVEKQE